MRSTPMSKPPAKRKTAPRKSKGDDLRQYHFKGNPEANRAFKILNHEWAANNLPL
jgi:hypothetical protein